MGLQEVWATHLCGCHYNNTMNSNIAYPPHPRPHRRLQLSAYAIEVCKTPVCRQTNISFYGNIAEIVLQNRRNWLVISAKLKSKFGCFT